MERPKQHILVEDLAGVFRGDLSCEAVDRAVYALTTGSTHVLPLGIARPRDRDDLIALVRYSAENEIPLCPRGAGSNPLGSSPSPALLVDCTASFRQLSWESSELVRVETGLPLEELNRQLAAAGRYFPIQPEEFGVGTVGGLVAVDAAGSRSPRYGSCRDLVREVEFINSLGVIISAQPTTLIPPWVIQEPMSEAEAFANMAANQLARLWHAPRTPDRPELSDWQRSPYRLDRAFPAGETVCHWHQVFVGSEGTLGQILSVVLETAPLPAAKRSWLVACGTLDAAVRLTQRIADLAPLACDLLDRRMLSLAVERDERFERILSQSIGAALLIEQHGDSDAELNRWASSLEQLLLDHRPDCHLAAQGSTDSEHELLWSLGRSVVSRGTRRTNHSLPLMPILAEATVPPAALYDVLIQSQRILQKHDIAAAMTAHALGSRIIWRGLNEIGRELIPDRYSELVFELYQLAWQAGGSIRGDRGLPPAPSAVYRREFGPAYRVCREIKEVFDPGNLWNPGRLFSAALDDGPTSARESVRDRVPAVPLQLNWALPTIGTVTQACHGCGGCRGTSSNERMCPFFRESPLEEHAPRAKAAFWREALLGELTAADLASPPAQRLSNSCFNCKQCLIECPNGVDIPHLAIEARAQIVAGQGLSRGEWLLARADRLGAWGTRFATTMNWLMGRRSVRWVVEKTLGISRKRRLPRFARKSFLQAARSEWLTAPTSLTNPRPVILFVDHFANYFDPELAEAAVRLLEFHGHTVYVPPTQRESGLALVSIGDLDSARKVALDNVRLLGEYAREGCRIVCLEPASVVCLRDEYPFLIDHPDVPAIAQQAIEIGAFLAGLAAEGQLKPGLMAVPGQAIYHLPCHMRYLHQGSPLIDLCGRIPQLTINQPVTGCSGVAGTFGMLVEHFDRSLEIGRDLHTAMAARPYAFGLTECSSCRLQMEQPGPMPTIHPLKILALAYGLMPHLRSRLFRQRRNPLLTP